MSLPRILLKTIKSWVKQPKISLVLCVQQSEVVRGFNFSQEGYSSAINDTQSLCLRESLASQLSNPLMEYFASHKEGKGIWKWNHYFELYQKHFQKFVGHEVHILEIGIYSGGSLEMWKHYFGSQCHVYGVDIEEACRAYENEYTKIFIGDQADPKLWKFVKEHVPKIDILIDDGGHQAIQQIITLEEMLPFISPGGVYFCEDIHDVDNAFISYLFGMLKSLNAFNRFSDDAPVNPTPFQSWIKAIHFYPYVSVIEKAENPEKEFSAPKHGTEWQPFYNFLFSGKAGSCGLDKEEVLKEKSPKDNDNIS